MYSSNYKKYSILLNEQREVVAFEIDGVRYDHAHEVVDPGDRAVMMRLMVQPWDDLTTPEVQVEGGFNLFTGIFFGVSVLLLAIATATGVFAHRTLTSEVTAPGRVIELVPRRDSDGDEYYYPKVEFAIPEQGVQTVQLNEGSWPPSHNPGEAVTIRYNPERPQRARIDSLGSNILLWLPTMITGAIGLIFLTISIAVFSLLRPVRPKSSSNL
ncbi:DUF3592 domain-containing protein [Leptolyngbya sp. AN02str]|uniref:DUF3592 domain-containing protein n=1 Tax=Leptolyngbya sp. AN02str TaxID=3423363 RepID=UPI003D317FCB